MRSMLLLTLFLFAGLNCAARAAGTPVRVCFDYGCAREAIVEIDAATLVRIGESLGKAQDAGGERARLARAVADIYVIAGQQTPIWRDRGENVSDDRDQPGAMDCIDHSTNTTAFLRLMEGAGLLRFHRVIGRLRRSEYLISEHWTARVAEHGTGAEFSVDTWFFEPGVPAVIMPIAEWRAGGEPGRRVEAKLQ